MATAVIVGISVRLPHRNIARVGRVSICSYEENKKNRLVVYSKPGCCLCEGLIEKLQTAFLIGGENSLSGTHLEVRDITTNPAWENAYRYEIPLLTRINDDGFEEVLPRMSARISVEQLQKKGLARAAMDDMDVDWDVRLCYCIADHQAGVNPSVAAVLSRGSTTGVAAGSKFSDAVKAVKEAAAQGEVQVHRLVWVPISSQANDYVCKKGEAFYFRLTTQGAHSGPSSVRDEKSMVESLLNTFRTAAVDARSQPVIALQKDLGQQFKIAGRETTYEVLLKGTAAMFKRFVSPLSEFQEYQREQPFYFAMVAFPGAGKTTLGTRAWPFLKERWESLGSGEERRRLLSMLADEEFDRFEAMCTTSLQYNLCMYHLVATDNGGVLEKEEGLLPRQILALRCLAAVLDVRDYNQFCDRLDSACSGMKHHITLSVVLKFLWRALGMEKGNELLVPFFFDEVNQVTRHLDGREVTGGGPPTWFQEMMSAYVQEEHKLALDFDNRIEKVFPVFSVASTRFSVTSLRFTASAKATGLSVPFQPLTSQECEGVVLDLLGRWADTLEIPKCTSIPDSTQFIIDVSGGMPRALSRGLQALCGTTKLDECFKRCSTTMGFHELVRVVQQWEHTLATTYFSAYYGDPNKADVLCRVLALSLLRKPVRRNMSVLESGRYRHITYGDLEDSGLVALTAASELQYLLGQSDIGASEVLIKCSPFLVWSLLKCLEGIPTPSFTRTSSRDKEAEDLMSVLLRIYLLERAFGHQEFSLIEILPPGAYIPQFLQDRKFSLQCNNYGIFEHHHKLRDRAGFKKMREEARRIKGEDYCAFLACGNEAGDSYIVLKDTLVEGKEVVLVIQSKTTSSDTFQGFSTLVDNLERDLGWFQKVQIPRALIQELKGKWGDATPWEMKLRERKRSHQTGAEFLTGSQYDTKMAEVCGEGGGMDTVNFVYVFMSNRPVSRTFKLAVQAAQEVVPWFDRVVLAYECEARDHGDALSVLTSIRRWKDLF